jgi:hypothetical protein
LFSREGGSPVWAPAFAGEQACSWYPQPAPYYTTPAEAGAQMERLQ